MRTRRNGYVGSTQHTASNGVDSQQTGASRTASPEQLEETLRTSLPALNNEQKNAFDQIVGSMLPGVSVQNILSGNTPNADGAASSDPPATANRRVFFLDAPGGTGKTFFINVIQAFLQLRHIKLLPVATSAVAAGLLMGGRTAYSTFKIPIPALEDSTCTISSNSDLAKMLREVGLIIWDEIVMAHRFCVEAVNRTLRDLTGTNLPFGGKFVLFSRDFRQILPVVPGGSRAQVMNACIKSSHLFECCMTLRLTKNMRLKALRNDPSADQEALQFPAFLLLVGQGRLPSNALNDPDLVDLPSSVTLESSLLNICRNAFSDMAQNYTDIQWLSSRAVLTTKNSHLTLVNKYVGDMIPGTYREYLSADKVANEEENALRYPVEMLNLLTAGSALPDHRSTLKKGFIVMLLRNLDQANGHTNGTRYVVENMSNHLLYLRIATGAYQGQELCLPRVPCGPGDDTFPIPGFPRTQFPIRVCFGITTNKS